MHITFGSRLTLAAAKDLWPDQLPSVPVLLLINTTLKAPHLCYHKIMFSQQSQQKRIKQNHAYPQWFKLLMSPISWPHEMTHHLTGRALGVPIQRHDFHITYLEKPPLWKDLIITLMPTVLGFSILFSSIFILLISEPLAELVFWYGIVMFFTCLSDWIMAYKEVVDRSVQRPTD